MLAYRIFKVPGLFALLLLPTLCCGQSPKLWNIDTTYTLTRGREAELSHIHDNFNNDDDTNILAITGLPGYGKTELSKAYAKTFKNEYDVCWLFDSNRPITTQIVDFAKEWNKSFPNNKITITNAEHTLMQEFKHKLSTSNTNWLVILDNFNINKDNIYNLKNTLRTSQLNWLLIFDDASKLDDIKPLAPQNHTLHKGHILITSQTSETWPNVYRLDVLKQESITKLFNAKEQDLKYVNNIAHTLKNHPFAIYNAYKEMHANSQNLKDFSNILSTAKTKNTIDPAVKMTKRHIDKFTSEPGNKNSKLFIELLYFMDNNFIPDELLKTIWGKLGHDESSYDNLITKSINGLIIEPQVVTPGGIKFYKYHDIVKAALALSISDPSLSNSAKIIAAAIKSRTHIDDAPYLNENFHLYSPSIENLISHANILKINDANLADLYLTNLEYLALVVRDYRRCIAFINSSHTLNKYISKKAPREQALRFHTTLSGIYWWLGDHRQGIIHQQAAEKIASSIGATNTVQYQRILNYAISHYLFLGDADKAKPYIDRLSKTSTAKPDANKFDTSNLTNVNYASFFNLTGQYVQSSKISDSMLESIKDKPSFQFIYYSSIYLVGYESHMYLKDNSIPLEDIKNTVALICKYLGDNHRITALARIILSAHLINYGHTNEALKLLQSQLLVLKSWFGNISHREIALTLQLIGDCFYHAGDLAAAKSSYECAYENYHHSFISMKNDYAKRTICRLILVNARQNESSAVHKLLSDYNALFGKDKKYNDIINNITTHQVLELSDV